MGTLIVTESWRRQIEAWEQYLRAANRPATTRGLRTYHLRRLATDHRRIGPFDVTFDDLIAWLAERSWSAETRRSYRASLRQFYRWAHATGRIGVDPAYELPTIAVPRGIPRPAPDDVIHAALERATARERLMVLVLAHTGMRRGELARLHSGDLERDLIGWSLRVSGKGGRERLVPISDELARTLAMLPPGYVFPGRIDGHLSARRVGELVGGVLGAGWTAHTLRHRYATVSYALERDLRAVQELLGHARPETTAIYTLVPEESRRRAAMAVADSLRRDVA